MFKYGMLNCSLIFKQLFSKYSKRSKKAPRKENTAAINNIDEASITTSRKFGPDFYGVPCIELAKKLLGQTLVRRLDHERQLRCRIVETEAYLGGEDKAAHSSSTNRPTKKTNSSFMKPGTACVTTVYGVHLMFSISSLGDGASVLVRSAEPISGAVEMRLRRALNFQKNSLNPLTIIKDRRLHRLCAGPARLTSALAIDPEFDGNDLITSNKLWLEEGPETVAESQIVECPRVGLPVTVGDWADKSLRYYILGHTSVSQRNKAYEEKLMIASGIISEDGKLLLK